MEQIGALWQNFMQPQVMEQLSGAKANPYAMLCAYHDYESLESMNCDIIIGCEGVVAIPDGMALYTIPAGKYMKFSLHGDAKDAVIEGWEKLWALEDVHKMRSGKIDFEAYYPTDDPSNADIDLFIGIK
jgi:predicted transcriptional regulator YdeE